MNCDFCQSPTAPIFVTDDGEDICAKCLAKKEEREAEAAAERQTVWADAPWTFAKNH